MSEKISITYSDVHDPRVDDMLERQAAVDRAGAASAEAAKSIRKENFIYKSWFSLSLAGMIGAALAWSLIEPSMSEAEKSQSTSSTAGFLLFALTGGLVGLMVGGLEGVLSRNFLRAIKGALVGLGIGFGGGLLSTFVANFIFSIIIRIGVAITGSTEPAHNFGLFFMVVIARGFGWMVAGMTVGLGPGIAIKSHKLIFNGFLGGTLGGMIGGIFFDPICYMVSGGTMTSGGSISRALGLILIGTMAGLMIGLVETFTKSAWLLMTKGPITGKQFIIYKNPTIIGSSPQSEIYLFKDPDVEHNHASLSLTREGYRIEDNDSSSGTWVNGVRVKARQLINGDTIRIGRAEFIYAVRDRQKKSGF